MSEIRFQFDECVSNDVAAKLREFGIDVITAHEAGLRGQPDYIALAHAHTTGRVMVTYDRDYLRLNDAGHPHCGIAYREQGTQSTSQMIEDLVLIHGAMTPDELRNWVEYL